MVAQTLNINERKKLVCAPPDMPLLWVLRDVLHMHGTKVGCGAGLCGACTVHVDGIAMRSCLLPFSSLAGKKIRTIEGLAGESLHPLQEAWLTHRVPQCGYCQPGQLMSAAALLSMKPTPTDAEIDAFMAGNICRCGTYPRIKAAIRSAAQRTAIGAKHEP